MQMQIDCQWNDQSAWCTNKKVKRSLFGLGARCCIMFDSDKVCSFYKATPSPIAPSPCPHPNKKKELDIERPKVVDAREFVEGLPYIGEYYQPESRVYKKKDAEKYFDFLENEVKILKDKLKASLYH